LVAGNFATFADSVGDFASFTQAHTDPATFVANDNQRAKIETASAFDNLGGTVDEDHLFDKFLLAVVAGLVFRVGPGPTTAKPSASSTATLLMRVLLLLGLRLLLLLLLAAFYFGCSATMNTFR
jgi:hypothetical protein